MIPSSSGSSSPPVLGVAGLSFGQPSEGSSQQQGGHDPSESNSNGVFFRRHSFHRHTEQPVGGARHQAQARSSSTTSNGLHEASHSLPDLDLAFLLEALDPPSLEDRNWLRSLTPVSTPASLLADIDLSWPADTPSSSPPPPPPPPPPSSPTDDSHVHRWPSQQPGGSSTRPRQKQIISEPLAASSSRVAEKRRKDSRSMIPFNLKASTKDEAMYDGYRWQKYGKKAIRNSPHPRYYYKCVSKHCNARKQVQHSPMDEGVILTTYEGMHNHEPPTSIAVGVVVSATSPCFCSSSGSLPCLSCLNLARAPLHNPHPSHQQNALHQ